MSDVRSTPENIRDDDEQDAGQGYGEDLARAFITLLALRSFSDQHGLQDLIGNFFDGSRRVRQEKRISLIAFADGFKCIKILSHQHQLHNF
jgi:hypothetical protein